MAKPFKTISGPYTLDYALEYAREGRPDMLLMMIGDTLGTDAAAVLADLLQHPEKLCQRHRAKVLPHEAEAIREHFAMLKRANPKKAPAVLRDLFAPRIGIDPETLRDILEQKKTYAPKDGEHAPKRSPRRRKG